MKHFEGVMESTVTCGTCQSENSRSEPFVDLQVHFDESDQTLPDSLEGMLQRSFADEVLDKEDNLYFCNNCDCKVPLATKSYKFTKLP